jgi:signal transduction histidine kinase
LVNPSAIREFKLDSSAKVDVENLDSSLEVYRSDGSVRPLEEAPTLRALKGEVVKNLEEIVKTPASEELCYRQVSSAPVRDKDGRIIGAVSVVHDITELKNLQKRLQEHTKNLEILVEERSKQLRDSERMAAIGQTAGMVGHDIRNPLQSILSDLYLAKSDLTSLKQSDIKESLEESLAGIETEVGYISKIVQDLQDFAKPVNPAVEEVDLEKLFEGVVIKIDLLENIETSCKVGEGAKKILTDPTILKRSLTNLVNNAIQAMPNGGKLSLEAYKDRNEVVLIVEDTGVGIPDKIKAKLFTPLFTTKSKGQGFVLAAVKRLIQALGGTITFESQVGKGTKFILTLPQKK